jgi:hypothetical protein
MKVKVNRDMHRALYEIRFQLEGFTDEEIYLIKRYGPFTINLPRARWRRPDSGENNLPVNTDLESLPFFTFFFDSSSAAKGYAEAGVKVIKDKLDSFVASAIDFVGETVFEIKVGEEVRRISEGARKALDKDSQEYKEIIEKNREAFEKLSKL